MYIYKENPWKGGADPNPLLEAALAFVRQGWPVLPVRPFWLHPHILRPCPHGEPICPATGWPNLMKGDSLCTTIEDTVREMWTDWSDAAIGLWCIQAPHGRILPATPTNVPHLNAGGRFYLIVYWFRDGKIRLAYAAAVIWREREMVHPLVRDFLAKVRRQEKRGGGLCALH